MCSLTLQRASNHPRMHSLNPCFRSAGLRTLSSDFLSLKKESKYAKPIFVFEMPLNLGRPGVALTEVGTEMGKSGRNYCRWMWTEETVAGNPGAGEGGSGRGCPTEDGACLAGPLACMGPGPPADL